jgi:hypothetical protein
MQRFIDHAVRPAGLSRGRFALLGVAGILLSLAAFPALASAATQTLTVKKAGTGTGTVTSSPAGIIECGATCSASVAEGVTVVLIGTPGTNTAAVAWSGCDKVNLENECSVTMSAPKTVTATFNLLERKLTVEKKGTGTGTVTSSPAGIECGATCSASFVKETTVTLTGTPGPKTLAASWTGCDSVNAENKCVVTMTTVKSVTVTFDLPAYQLTVKKAGAGAGTVTSSPAGISCGAICSAPFAEQSTATLTGTPDANSTPVVWSGCDSENEGKCLVAMSKAKEVTATFKLVSRQLTVKKAGAGTGTVISSPAGIECGKTCSASFEHGTLVTLTGFAGTGTDPVVQWTGCGTVSEGKCLVTMSAAKEVTATFNLVKWQLAITKVGSGTGKVTSSPAGIDCGATCSASFTNKTKVTLEGEAGLHTRKVKWSGCDEVLTGNKCVVTMSAARTVIASFDLELQWTEYLVTVQKKGTGKGTVTSVPGGIECGSDCSEAYLYHTQITLTATPEEGSKFVEWQGGGCLGQSGPCTLSVNGSRLLRAVFVAVGNRRLTVSKAGAGSGTVTSKPVGIECGPTCSVELDASTKAVLRATPAAGSAFTGWSGEGCIGTATCIVPMNEARNVTATFAKLSPAPSVILVLGSAKVKGGKALLRLICDGGTSCQGTLRLRLIVHGINVQGKALTIASADYSLAPGASQTLAVKLSPRALAQLGSHGIIRVRVSGRGIESHPVRLAPR